MYTSFIFIGYIAALVASALCIFMICLVMVQKSYRDNPLFIAIRAFSVITLLLGFLYFVFYYRETVMGAYELNAGVRIVDYILWNLFYLSMLGVMNLMVAQARRKKMRSIAAVVFIVITVTELLVAALAMDPYYGIANASVRNFFSIASSAFALCYLVLAGSCTYLVFRDAVLKRHKRYALFIFIIVFIWETLQRYVEIGLYFGRFGKSAWDMGVIDLTSFTMCLCAIATMVFVFIEDFSPLYIMQNHQEPAVTGGENRAQPEDIDLLAQEHHLTVREREVLALLAENYSNSEIADELVISINTVKKHVKNVYEKLGVTSRVELVFLITGRIEPKA